MLVSYERQRAGRNTYYRRSIREEWWTVPQEARRLKLTPASVQGSINKQRPTHVPSIAYCVDSGPHKGEWLTRKQIEDMTGWSKSYVGDYIQTHSGIYVWREPDPKQVEWGKKSARTRQANKDGKFTGIGQFQWKQAISKPATAFNQLAVIA